MTYPYPSVVTWIGSRSALVLGTAALAGAQSLYPLPGTRVGINPQGLATGDFDEDGYLDFAAAVVESSTGVYELQVHRNDQLRSQVLLGSFPGTAQNDSAASVVAADFNHDSHLDLVTAAFPFSDPRVLLGDGDGSFTLSATLSSYDSRALATGDVDGDGNVDVVVANHYSDTIDIHLGDGAGGFVAGPALFLYAGLWSAVAVVDLDSNGALDVAAVSSLSTGLAVFYNQGAGSFGPASFLTTSIYQARSVDVGDVDGDGRPDLIAGFGFSGQTPGLGLYLATDPGQQPSGIMIAVASTPWDAVVLELDGDDHPDLVVLCYGEIDVFFGTGDGGTAMLGAPVRYEGGVDAWGRSLAAGDFDRDGFVDLAYTNSPDTLQVLYGDDQGSFPRPNALTIEAPPLGLAVGDLNLDGFADAVVSFGGTDGSTANGLSSYLGDGSGSFPTIVTTTTASNVIPGRLNGGDLDGDGLFDVVATGGGPSPFVGEVQLWHGSGDGSFASLGVLAAQSFCERARIADLDDDGLADVIASSHGAKTLFVWRGLGSGAFANAMSFASVHNIGEFELADLNADGLLDLVSATEVSGTHSVFFNTGGASFALVNLLSSGTYHPYTVALVDVDDDGLLDIVSHATNAGFPSRLTYHPGTGGAGFGPVVPLDLTSGNSLEVGDVDGDGELDLVSSITTEITVQRGEGAGLFGGTESFLSGGSYPSSTPRGGLRLVDLDQDGRLDVLHLSQRLAPQGALSVLLNQGDTCSTTIYCSAKVNSQGCSPSIDSSGCASATAGAGFTISCSDAINNKLGRLFYSLTGPIAAPFLGGTLCVKPPLLRTPQTGSGGNPPPAADCSGAYSIDFNVFIAGGTGNPALQVPGTNVHVQWWGRDPAHADAFKVQLSNALAFLIHP